MDSTTFAPGLPPTGWIRDHTHRTHNCAGNDVDFNGLSAPCCDSHCRYLDCFTTTQHNTLLVCVCVLISWAYRHGRELASHRKCPSLRRRDTRIKTVDGTSHGAGETLSLQPGSTQYLSTSAWWVTIPVNTVAVSFVRGVRGSFSVPVLTTDK